MQLNPAPPLTIVLIRHGEKPIQGDNLSPQGFNRALQLPTVLHNRFGVPNHVYVPAIGTDITTTHARMFQTVTPFAIQYNLGINSKFDEHDYTGIADHVRTKTGLALFVWEHHAIPELAKAMGISNPPDWPDDDYDSIWIIAANQLGNLVLTMDKQHITPA